MTIKQLLKDLKLLIKNNVKIVVSFIIATFILLSSVIFFINRDRKHLDNLERSDSSVAEMGIYIENEDDTSFMNSYLLEILINNDETISMIEKEVNANISSVIDEFTEENDPIYTDEDPINVKRNTSSDIHEITIDLGKSDTNLAVANAIKDWLLNTDQSILEDREVYIIYNPELLEDNLSSTSSNVNEISLPMLLLIASVLSLIIGFILSLIFLIIKEFLSDGMNYSFAYSRRLKDHHINLEHLSDNEVAHYILQHSNNEETIILTDNKLDTNLLSRLNEYSDHYSIYKSFSDIPVSKNFKNITLMVVKSQTSKSWYTDQIRSLNLFDDVEVRVIEI